MIDVLCIAEGLHYTLGKLVDVYELWGLAPKTALYVVIFAERVRIA